MSRTIIRTHTATKQFLCEGHKPGCTRLIEPGQRYQMAALPPGTEPNYGDSWWRMPTCAACATYYGYPLPPTPEPTWGEHVARPDGSIYRARLRPEVHELGGHYDDFQVLVTRTHDLDVASALAAHTWWSETSSPLPAPRLEWTRYVPWDAGSGYDGTWMWEHPNSRRGVPCVVYS